MSDDGQKGSTATRLPEISAEVREDGTGEISIDGVVERISKANLAEAGAAITSRIAELAESVGQPVPVQVRDPEGLWSLMIHPDGVVDEAPSTPRTQPNGATPPAPSEKDSVAAVAGFPDAPAAPVTPPTTTARGPAAKRADAPPTPVSTPEPKPAAPSGPLPTLDDLLAARHPVATGGPAEHGWRRGVGRVTFGAIKPGPGKGERRSRAASASVRRTLDGPKTIVVINPKGGAHKTTATMLLAATFGLQRGGYTLAWDNNETRGTLGWRSSHADHTRTAVDLLQALPALGEQGTVRIGDLDGYVRTQPTEQFDVLASDENSASASSVDAQSFTDLHQVLSRFYRVLVIDTGNNMRASNWQAAITAADQIVVVSTIREDTAQSAAWALDALRSTGHEEAVSQAVTVLSAPEPKVDKDLHKRLRSHFGALTRTVIDVPHDRALVAGGPIDYEALDRRTRDAWLHVTAVVAEGL